MRKSFIIMLICTVLISSSYWVGYSFGKEKDPMYKELDILAESLALVEQKHVNEKKPQELIYGALQGLLSSLDAYSQFLPPDEYKELLTETEGEFGGLGIEIALKDNLLTVMTAMEDTPASNAGLESGDIIVKINGELTRGITINDAVKKLRGAPKSKVDISVLKINNEALKDITIMRDIIHIKDIKRAMVLENDIGYVKIAEFRENTAKELDIALKELKSKSVKGLVIDVRNNPGGLLYSAIEIASRFLDTGKVVVSTKTRGEAESVYKATDSNVKITDVPIVLLMNKGSASASEILAGALRENNRAVLVGEKTFGKGSVQTIIPMSDGSALRLTTSLYYTPAGVSIHEKGILPDIEVVSAFEGENGDMVKNTENNQSKEVEVFNKVEDKSEPAVREAFDYKNDTQLMRALDLVRGLLVVSSSHSK